MINHIIIVERAKKQLEKTPPQIKTKFKLWVKSVQEHD